MSLVRRVLGDLVTALLVPVLLFEEWGWEPLAALAARIGRLPVLAAVERRIATLSPRMALLVFIVPVIALFPIKIFALFLFGEGHIKSGFLLLIGAKLAGTGIVARLFQLTQPALMQLPVFARWYTRWKTWKDHVLQMVRASRAWRAVDALRERLKRGWRALRRAD